jgi:hypothetical protein
MFKFHENAPCLDIKKAGFFIDLVGGGDLILDLVF